MEEENVQLPPLCWLEMGFGVVGLLREELPSWIWLQTGGEAAPARNFVFP